MDAVFYIVAAWIDSPRLAQYIERDADLESADDTLAS